MIGRVVLASAALLATHAPAAVTPFVGCPSGGQLGPQAPPKAESTPRLPASAAAKLAYYKAYDGPGVLAPRGWHCFGTYGSNGSVLVVAPRRLNWQVVTDKRGLDGPAIQLDDMAGDTSGRFEVAAVVGQLFPTADGYVTAIEKEGIAGPFPRHPVATDRIKRRGPTEALYTTPIGKTGLGTQSHLRPGPLPIDGIVRWRRQDDDSLTMLHARLPAPLRPLVAYIIRDIATRL